jgi:hypothetical protein
VKLPGATRLVTGFTLYSVRPEVDRDGDAFGRPLSAIANSLPRGTPVEAVRQASLLIGERRYGQAGSSIGPNSRDVLSAHMVSKSRSLEVGSQARQGAHHLLRRPGGGPDQYASEIASLRSPFADLYEDATDIVQAALPWLPHDRE